MLAPIALFVFARPRHTRRTIDSLRQNELARESDLFVFADAPKTEAQTDSVREVRQYMRRIEGFKSVTIVERAANFGLAKSIVDGVTSIVNSHGRVIVLEDDLVTSPHFLTYMNEALEKYSNDDRVASIHGYVWPCSQPLPETFFLPGADCWGWATWRRGWDNFNSNGQYLLDELKRRNLTGAFDYDGAAPFLEMLEEQIKGKNDSWAIRWHASAFLAGKLTLYPGRSLVHNIGNDGSGTHSGDSAQYDAALSAMPIVVSNIKTEPSQVGMLAFADFFRGRQSGHQRLGQKVSAGKCMKSIKALAKDWLPPAMLRWARRIVLRYEKIGFDGDFAAWEEASVRCTGYDAEGILTKVLEATLKVARGEEVFERDSVLFDEIEYAWPVLAGLMWAAARNSGKLNVLDFGGALGSSYFQNRKFLEALPEIHWNIVEQAHYVDAGRANIKNERLKFYKTIDECLNENLPNVVLLSGVLQYLPEPYGLLSDILEIQPEVCILDRTCYLNQKNSQMIRIQHVTSSIYSASYPCRYFDEDHIQTLFENGGYSLFESFDALDKLDPLAKWKGHIYLRANHEHF